jgi:anti-sigma factor RsiW
MSEHDEIRDLLSLAAAGALDQEEEQRVAQHLRTCSTCATELDNWQSLTSGLRRLATPQPSAGLIERTRAAAAWQFAAEGERRWNQGVILFVVLFAWTLTLATWPLVRLVTGGVMDWLQPGFGHTWTGLVGYTAMVWLTGGIAAGTLAVRRRRERSLT